MIDSLLLPLAVEMNVAYSTVPTWQNASRTAHVVQAVIGGINAFLWLGTEDLEEWILDDFNPLIEASPNIGWVHQPSLENVQEILPFIVAKLTDLGWPPYYFVGHSKGAREAPIAHALMKEAGHPPLASRIYEPPRTGHAMLATYLATENILGTRMTNIHGDDQITWVPIGLGWEDCCRVVAFRVPDTYGLRAKHVMTGVIVGLTRGVIV